MDIHISEPLTKEQASYESGYWISWTNEAYPHETVLGTVIGGAADEMVKASPIYDLSAGDRIAKITRLYESVHVVKYRKTFYFNIEENVIEVMYIN